MSPPASGSAAVASAGVEIEPAVRRIAPDRLRHAGTPRAAATNLGDRSPASTAGCRPSTTRRSASATS